jgi:hypothetical protein
MLVEGRQFGDQEWELFGHIYAHKVYLGDIGLAIGIFAPIAGIMRLKLLVPQP